MPKNQDSPTKALFDCLSKLYKQGQLLLLDADRLIGEHGWEPMHTTAPAEYSYSLNSPERWYARWATRFYRPIVSGKVEIAIKQLLFVSIHFASDHDTSVDEPVVSARRLVYEQPMNLKAADKNYDYYMCKYWFWGQPHEELEGWRHTKGSKFSKNLKGSETFALPLYSITSSEELKKLVIDPLVAVVEKA